MINVLFVVTLAASIAALLIWGCKTLPQERWQMIASVPVAKRSDGGWAGLNLTFYGFFSASGCVFGIALATVLLSSLHVSIAIILLLVAFILALCLPASRLVAAIVEKKRSTYTIAGAAFVAAIVLPPAVWSISRLLPRFGLLLAPMPVLAAIGISYALAEAIGRMACMSFGCCYGMPLRNAPLGVARLFGRFYTVFRGSTKKAAYASGLEEEPLIPVQALTSIMFAAAGLIALSLFLAQHWRTAVIVSVVGTWGWRALAENLRADHRGHSRISSYQAMSIIAMLYLTGSAILLPANAPAPDLILGLSQFTTAGVILLLQALWIFLFLFYGRSQVTASQVSFYVVTERT